MNKKMIQKTLVGLCMVAIAIPIFYYGGIALKGLVGIFTILAAYEIVDVIEKKPNWFLSIIVAFLMYAVGTVSLEKIGIVIAICILCLTILALAFDWLSISSTSILLFVILIMGFAVRSIHLIYETGLGGKVALFVAIACYVCDTGAYFFGSFFGKHKMAPKVSPNKTWEGAIGGYLLAFIISLGFGLYFCKTLPKMFLFANALVLPIVGEIGDLAFSLIKRHYSVKDYGSLFPGHGGVLDRIDSLLFCLMFFFAFYSMWGL